MTRALRDTVFPKAGPGYRSSGCLDATSGPGLIPSRLRYSVIQQRGTVISNNIYETGMRACTLSPDYASFVQRMLEEGG
jgi:hypothetical protein